jgi:hypothetical protein
MNKKIYVILIFILVFFSFNHVFAENFTDLNQEINENDFIELHEDVVLNQNASGEDNLFKEGIVINNKELYIEGNNHTIYGNDSEGNHVRVFSIINSKVTLANMVIASASVNGSGGAINLSNGSDLILKNVTFRDNSAMGIYGEGGAIYARGHIFIYNCTFENNFATGAAGAVYGQTTSYIEGTDFINNSANWYGGGILASYRMNINSCSFKDNKAYRGSAFHYTVDYDDENASIKFDNCAFVNNIATEGTVSTSSFRTMIFDRCTFTDNRANRGGVTYKASLSKTFIKNCFFENNSAEFGALFYEGSSSYIVLWNSYLINNHASDKGSVFYGKSSNFWANNTVFYNNTNNVICDGNGNITVENSRISNYESDFITQFLGGNIIIANNTWGVSDLDENLDVNYYSNDSYEMDYNRIAIVSGINSIPPEISKNSDSDCCSVYVRINQTDFAIAHRRDSNSGNLTQSIDQNEDYVKYYKPTSEYFFLTKVYNNGWVIGTGGLDEAVYNEKVEAIASDMVKNQYIDPNALEMIFKIKKEVGRGHLLIVAQNGTYGNVLYHGENNLTSFFEIGVLDDNSFIVSPNGPDYRRQGYLYNLTNPVKACIYFAAIDEYGIKRHCIVVNHITLSDVGFSDALYVSNEDGRFINQSNAYYCDQFWFKEVFTPSYEIPLILDSKYLGTYYFLNRTIISQNVTIGYNSDYLFTVQFINHEGDFLVNHPVNLTVNGKTNEYITNNKGIIKIPFTKLSETQNIILTNPITGEVSKNTIKVVPRLIGSNVVMDYFDGSKYIVKVYGANGKLVGADEIVTIKVNKKSYKVRTNDKGLAILKIPNTLIPKTYTVIANYNGQSIKNTIKVKQILKTKNMVIKKSSKKIVLKATLKTSKNKPIKFKKIYFKFNGKTFKAKTNSKGIAKITINKKVINKLKIGKKYTLKVVYLKDIVKSIIRVKR